jgi:AraC family transcriptional regulator
MEEASVTTLYRGEDFSVDDWVCDGCDTASNRTEMKPRMEVVFVRRGMFVAESREGSVPLTPNEIWVHPPHLPYRVRHPHGRDECTVITLSPALEDCYGFRATKHHRFAAAKTFGVQHRLWSVLSTSREGDLRVDESVLSILDAALQPLHDGEVNDRQRRIVRRVQQLLASRFSEKLSLRAIARAAEVSPYHLSRIFRRATGSSLHAYQTSLRLREALRRLSDGEQDLTGLALDLGFSDHSHFTNSFRRHFGGAPSKFRERSPAARNELRRDSRVVRSPSVAYRATVGGD